MMCIRVDGSVVACSVEQTEQSLVCTMSDIATFLLPIILEAR